jgi:hypothetical protein
VLDDRDVAPVALVRVDDASRTIVESLLPLYLHDLSEFRGTLPSPNGRYEMGERRAAYFTDPDRGVYLFVREDRPVGFAMLKGFLIHPCPSASSLWFAPFVDSAWATRQSDRSSPCTRASGNGPFRKTTREPLDFGVRWRVS